MSIFAVELPVRLCADVRYKEFNFRKRAFDILSLTEIWKISIIEDMRQYTHAWDYCTLRFKGIIYLTAWAIVYYSMMGIPEPLLDSIQ